MMMAGPFLHRLERGSRCRTYPRAQVRSRARTKPPEPREREQSCEEDRISQRIRKRVEIFGWAKTIGGYGAPAMETSATGAGRQRTYNLLRLARLAPVLRGHCLR